MRSEAQPEVKGYQQSSISFPKTDTSQVLTPLYSHKISAGFPSPADDHIGVSAPFV